MYLPRPEEFFKETTGAAAPTEGNESASPFGLIAARGSQPAEKGRSTLFV
jgi:hypothetical protein